MSIESMDSSYIACCKNYLKNWVLKYNVQEYQISEEVLEEMISVGGGGLHSLEVTFRKVIDRAKEEEVERIDVPFVKQVLENFE